MHVLWTNALSIRLLVERWRRSLETTSLIASTSLLHVKLGRQNRGKALNFRLVYLKIVEKSSSLTFSSKMLNLGLNLHFKKLWTELKLRAPIIFCVGNLQMPVEKLRLPASSTF